MIKLKGEHWICPECSYENKLDIANPTLICDACVKVYDISEIDTGGRCKHGKADKICIPCLQEKEDQPHSALFSQEGGDHYTKLGDYQPWIVLSKCMTAEELKGAMKKDVIQYLMRESDKGGREDIKKAAHIMQIYLELTGGES